MDSGTACKVLLAEDAPHLLFLFSKMLRMNGFEVSEANDGVEAWEQIFVFHPHVVVTDLLMPRLDGVELIRMIRADVRVKTLPIIAITADVTGQAEQRARSAGKVDFLVKPIGIEELMTHIRAAAGAS